MGRADGPVRRAAGVELLLPRWEPGAPMPVGSASDAGGDTLFVLDPLSEAAVLAEGGRLSDEYSDYFSPEVGRAPLVRGPFGRLGVGQCGAAGRPALVYPLDGLLPSDEFTLSLWFRVVAGAGPAGETILVQAARVLNVTFDGARLSVALKEWGVSVAADVPVAVGEWTPVTVLWSRGDLSVYVGSEAVAHGKGSMPPDATPASWCDGGLLVLPGAVDTPSVEVAEVAVQRWCRTPGRMLLAEGPTVRVDASSATGGAWSPWLGGALALYTGFRMWRDENTSVRDQQFSLCAEAGMPIVRVSGLVTAAQRRVDGTLDFAGVDDKLRVWRERGVALHVTLDYYPAAEGDWDAIRQVPEDFGEYAALCSEVLAHVRSQVRVATVALWNEPDIEDYWVGTLEQFFELWAVVRARLAADHPDLPLASGDFAHAETCARFLGWAGERGLPVSAAHFHNYDQDFAAIGAKVRMVRAAASAAGYAGLPIRITEWGMEIMRQRELYFGTTSVNRAWGNRFRGPAAAAYCLAFLAEVTAADPLVDMGAFSSVGSVEPAILGDENLFVSDEAMLSASDPPAPFPSFNAMSLLWKLRGSRVAATSNWPGVRAIATRSDGGVVTVAFGSYRPWRGTADSLDVALAWTGLPDRFTWQHWLVNQSTAADGRLWLAGEGDEADLPLGARIGALSAACIQITPR